MSRMVDADVLMLAFCNGLCGSDPEQCGVMDADRHEGCVLRKYIENAPTVGGWISVKERLPVGIDTVLIAHKGGVSFGWFNGAYWTRGAATKHKPIKTVTHWMPLPEPPKEVVKHAKH